MLDGTHTSCRTPERVRTHTHTQIIPAPSNQQPTQKGDFKSAHLRLRCHDNHLLDTHHEYDLGGERHPNRTDPDKRGRSQHHHHHQPVTAVEWLLYSVTEGVLQCDGTRCTLVRQCEAYSPTVGATVAVLTLLSVNVACLQLRHRTLSFPGRTDLQLLQYT